MSCYSIWRSFPGAYRMWCGLLTESALIDWECCCCNGMRSGVLRRFVEKEVCNTCQLHTHTHTQHSRPFHVYETIC